MEQLLDQKVRESLRAHRGNWAEIATCAKVSHSWISKFVNGHIPNPGYGRLQRLAEHLAALPPGPERPRRSHGATDLGQRGAPHE